MKITARLRRMRLIKYYKKYVVQNGIPLIRKNKIKSKRYVNRSILHLNDTEVAVPVRNLKTFLTNFEPQIDQGIQNNNSSPSLNRAEAFLNDIKLKKSNNRG